MSQRGARTAPPRWAEAALSTLLAKEDRESVLGEVRELYEIECARKGPTVAGRWYVRQVVGFAWQLARHGRRRGVPRGRSQFKGGMREQGEFWHALIRTLGLSLRRVRQAPGFAASVVVILALGIGANAVMFEVVDRLLFSPPRHIVDSDEVRLLRVRRQSRFTGEISIQPTLSYPEYQDFFAVDAFTVALYSSTYESTVGRGEAANRAGVVYASPNLFSLLGAQPTLGRLFPQEEDPLAANPVAVLAYEYWNRRYGRDPGVLGRTVDVGELSLTVIGIAPAGFTGAELAPVDIWIPISEWPAGRTDLTPRRFRRFRSVVRLDPGVTVEAAEAEATARHRGGWEGQESMNPSNPDAEVVLAPIIAARGPNPTSEARVVRWLAGVSLAVLLIACFNVANLLLARSIRTRREIAVRLALGASRRQLIGELLAESLVLATIGAGAALLIAGVLSDVVHEILLPNVAFPPVMLGGRLLGFALIATLATGLLTGLVPALQATKMELSGVLKNGGHNVAGERSKTRVALMVGQVALTVVLLVGAGLFVRSLRTAQELDLGFDPRKIVMINMEFNETLEPAERGAIYQTALERIRGLPGVHGAGLALAPPFRPRHTMGWRVPGDTTLGGAGGGWVSMVSSGYFEAMGLIILRGRSFEAGDDVPDAAPVAVINESIATAVWPGGDALGACMIIQDVPCTEVVGIVEDHRAEGLLEDTPGFMYFLNQEHPSISLVPETLMAGTRGDGQALVDLIRVQAARASTQIRFVNAISMSDYIEPEIRSWRLGASMFTAFGFLALFVAGWGLFSVLTFDVVLRQSELGIRSALGASPGRLVRLVLRQAVAFVAVGIGIGLFASWGASRLVEPLLFQVSATDPTIYLLVGVTLLLVAALAGSLPAWRATRVDPREALQAD